MCNVIYVNRGEIEIETPRQFEAHFGFAPDKLPYYNEVELDMCLCQVDYEAALTENNIPFKNYWGDTYIGEGLDEIKD